MGRSGIIFSIVLIMVMAVTAAGCGDDTGITPEDHSQIEVGMTMDDVDAILGQPERSHVTGSSIFWYYPKSDQEGLVKISFEQGKVTSVAPYDQSFEVGE